MSRTERALEGTTETVLSPAIHLGLSIGLTGLMGLALEYLGNGILHLHSYTQPSTFYIAIAVYAMGLGPLLYLLRKSWVIVPMVLVALIVTFLELANHYRFIDWQFVSGAFISRGLGSPRIWEFRDGALWGIRQPFLIALVSGATMSVIAPASLWTQRLVLRLIESGGKPTVPLADVESLFRNSVIRLEDLKVKRDFSFLFLRIFVIFNIAFLTLQLVSLIVGAQDIGAFSRLFVNPAQTANTLAKETLMLSVALVAAFNAGIRREATLVLLVSHVIAVGAQAWVYLGYAPNPFFPADHPYLLTGIISDAVVILLSLYVVLKGRKQPNDLSSVEDIELRSPASTILRTSLLAMGFLCVAYAAAIVCLRIFAAPETSLGAVFGGPDPFVTNMLTRYLALATVFFLLFAKPSLRKFLLPPVIVALSLGVIVCFCFALFGNTTIITRTGTTAEAPWFFIAQIVIDGGMVVVVVALRTMQYQVDYQITSLSPTSADCVMALHQALRELDLEPAASAREVLQRLNEYIAEIRSRRRGLLAFPFWLLEHLFPILTGFRPPFSTMSRDEQRWMLRRYVLRPSYEREKSAIPPLADFMSQIGDVINSLLSVTYFTTPRAHAQVGYVLPDARERLQPEIASLRPPVKTQPAPLPSNFQDPFGKKPVSNPSIAASLITPRVALAYAFEDLADEVDYCIIGSGAAGGVLAYRLGAAIGKGSSICVLERGAYNSPLQDFSDDELRMIRMLYTEGGLQMSRTFDFTILQGESVGGSTVVNNAICLQMPEVSRNDWAEFGINTDGLDSHYDLIKSEINIAELKSEAVNQRVESLFSKGIAGYNASCNGSGKLSEAKRLSGNFNNCLGCGLCNIGCRRLRKLSVLETYLPWAQAHSVKVYSNVGAVQCETQSNGKGAKKVTAVIVRRENGEFRRIRIRKALIAAAGAIASSRFLMRSELGGNGVGRGLSCNYAFPTLVQFREVVDAFDGVQITMFAAPDSFEAVFETTYNPPGAYSIATPLHFKHHSEMMRAYPLGVNFGALVGSDPCGSVARNRDLLFGRAIEWRQTEGDIGRIKKALATLVRIARASGAERIILPTHPALIIPLDDNFEKALEGLDRVLNNSRYFNFATAHPQGGNMMADESHDERVVDLDFRVRECENLFVCDASIFPRGIRVNPQWTIMALASAAAERIVELTAGT